VRNGAFVAVGNVNRVSGANRAVTFVLLLFMFSLSVDFSFG
jgi:hypothetical protein